MKLDVCAITVTYGNRWHLLRQVLEGLFGCPNVCEIIVVDNCADDPIAELVEQAGWSDKVRVVRSEQNTGSAGGFSIGLSLGAKSAATLLWLLDDDNMPLPGTLDRLLAAYMMMGEDPNVLLQCYRGDRYQYVVAATEGGRVGLIPNSFQGLHVRNIPGKILNRILPRPKTARLRFPCVEIECAPYGGLLLSRHWIEQIGLPNSDFFVYLDDYEFTYRITGAGGKIYLCASCELKDVDQSWSVKEPGVRSLLSPESPAFRVYYSVRNQTFLERNLSTSTTMYLANMIVVLCGLFVWSLAAGHSVRTFITRARLIKRAIREGWRGELGFRSGL
jgi:GT2 family glycosyltransferase